MDAGANSCPNGAAFAAPALAQKRTAANWFDQAIIIDALGSVGDPYSADDTTRFSDRGWSETVATGVTIVRTTVFPVGNLADPWGEYLKAIQEHQAYLKANPDHLLLIRSAADIVAPSRIHDRV